MEQHAVFRIPSLGSTVGVGKHNFTILRGDAGKGTFRMVCATTVKKWTCEAEVVLDCHDKVSSRIFTLSNEHPVYNDLRHSCHCAGVPNLLLTVAIREEQVQVTKTNSKDPSESKRFTDEADAKKLNANCRILFDGSPEPLFVNRHLLAIYSTVFRAMFEGDYKEKDAEEIAISNLKKEDFLAFLECLYHPVVPVDEKNIEAVLLVADRYHFEYLIDACKKHMLETSLVGGAQHKRYIAMAARYRLEDVMTTILGTFPPATVAELLEPQFMKELMDVNYEAASFILTQAAQKVRDK